ncbi:MAG: hypothetical protein A2142_09750 [candidate division Zixibacteria bacterium RBG_16_48_11]|nr:MAG: hypothetical protein A2142_09750 [candidate division Zixibacteria bacterium RBG_16_48_11]
MKNLFVGVDVGKYRSAVAILDSFCELLGQPSYFDTNKVHDEIIRLTNDYELLVGIDAPLSLPTNGNNRECEKKIRSQGIAIYPAGAGFFREISQIGIDLKKMLCEQSIPVVETYPYASRVKLRIGKKDSNGLVSKRRHAGRIAIQRDLRKLVQSLDESEFPKADYLDAVLVAYTVYLHHQEKTQIIDGEGAIVIPR